MKDYFGTSKTEFKKAVKKAVHQSNIEQAKLMKDWKKEFDKMPFYYGKVICTEENPMVAKKEMEDFISSLLLSQRKEVIEECVEEVKKLIDLNTFSNKIEGKVLLNILNKLK